MAVYPAARWRPVARYQPGGRACVAMAAYNRYCPHTAVSASSSLYGYFSKPGRATSHFYVDSSGDVEQYIDTAYRSSAQLHGNHDTITVETQDVGRPFPAWNTNSSNVPAWTHAQLEALARLGAWLHKTHGIRLQLCPNSRPGSKGFAYHRQGIDPWRVPGGEYWSKARGKVCPGDRRVAQMPLIVARAVQVAGGTTEDDMTPEERQMLREVHDIAVGKKYIDTTLSQNFNKILGKLDTVHLAVQQAAKGGLSTRYMLAAQIGAVRALAEQLTAGESDPTAVQAACEAGATAALRKLSLQLDEDGE